MRNVSLNKMAQSISIGLLLAAVLAFASARSHSYGIMGGELANITDFPHQVYFKHKTLGLLGSGVIISSQHILTINYCIGSSVLSYAVIAATDDRSTGGDEYSIAKVTKYPGDRMSVAVIKLASEIRLSSKAKPIALAGSKSKISDDTALVASGWGYTKQGGSESNNLRKVTISKVSDDGCKQAYGDDTDLSEVFCAGGNGKIMCFLDGGGPVTAKTRKGKVLVGLIGSDYTLSCNDPNKPSLFTKVSKFTKWIKEVVKKDLQLNEST